MRSEQDSRSIDARPLDFVPALIENDGKLPDGLLPSEPTAAEAICYLKELLLPADEASVARNAARIASRLPFNRLVPAIALQIHPYLSQAAPRNAELHAMCDQILFDLAATPKGLSKQMLERNKCTIYQHLSLNQLCLLDRLPVPEIAGEATSMSTAVRGFVSTAYKILDGILLKVAVQMSAWARLQWLSGEGRPQAAVDWMAGKTQNHDWFLASELRSATKRNDEELMELLTTKWGQLPSIGPEDKIHFQNENPADRRMRYYFGTASLERRWEQHSAPLRWLQKVAWNQVRRRKIDDEGEYIEAHEHGVPLVSMGELDPARSTQNRRSPRARSAMRRSIETPAGSQRAVELAPPVDDPLAAILPVSSISIDGLHLAIEIEAACRKIGLSEDAIRLARAKAASGDAADVLGFTKRHHKAKQKELQRAIEILRQELSAYRQDNR